MKKFLTLLLTLLIVFSFAGCFNLKDFLKNNNSSDTASSESTGSLTASSEALVNSSAVIEKSAFEYYSESYAKTNAIETGKMDAEVEQITEMPGMSVTTTTKINSLSTKKDGVKIIYEIVNTEHYLGSFTLEVFIDGDIKYVKLPEEQWQIVSDEEFIDIVGEGSENLNEMFPVRFEEGTIKSSEVKINAGIITLSFVFKDNALTDDYLNSMVNQGMSDIKLKSGSAEIVINEEGYITDIGLKVEYSGLNSTINKTVTCNEDYKISISDHDQIFVINRPAGLNENNV